LPGGNPSSIRRYLSIQGPADTGVLEFSTGAADGHDAINGLIQWTDINSVAADKRTAFMTGLLEGSTAFNRGGAVRIATKADGASGLTERFRVNSAGNVGIGITNPGQRLHVVGNILASGTGGTIIQANGNGSDTFQGGSQVYLGNVNQTGAAAIQLGGSQGLDIWNYNLTSGTWQKNMTVLNNGYVGIGITNPSTMLNVTGNQNANWLTSFSSTQPRGYNIYSCYNNQGNGVALGLYITGGGGDTNSVDLNVGGSQSKLVVRGDGYVGIGTASPAVSLDVKGRIMDRTGYVAPVGNIQMFGGAAAPAGWLLCDGSNVGNAASGATYAGDQYKELYDVIQARYGGTYNWAGNGKINLPNFSGVFPKGMGSQSIGGVAYSGATGAAQQDRMQGHKHTTSTGGRFLADGSGSTINTGGNAIAQFDMSNPVDSGYGTPRANSYITEPANVGVNYIIKY
jgi:microcystin-dependent protein